MFHLVTRVNICCSQWYKTLFHLGTDNLNNPKQNEQNQNEHTFYLNVDNYQVAIYGHTCSEIWFHKIFHDATMHKAMH
jgi:hypothetical protein